MSRVELQQPATPPAASIPDDDRTMAEPEVTYNSSACSSPRPHSMSLSLEQTRILNGPFIKHLSDDMLSIHSTKSEPFISAGPPALPEKSALRASRLLATLPQKLPHDRPVLTHAAPHIVYLSSEEDGSSSADDLSDLDSFDSDSEYSVDGGDAGSHAEFARAVSVVFSGKPSMINLTSRSASLASFRTKDDTALRITKTEPTLGRLRSTSTASSLYHPPRSSSMASTAKKRHPKFLNTDPFKTDKEDTDTGKPPKTPTAMFSRAFNNLVKKRSRQTLNAMARETEVVPMEQVGEEETEEMSQEHASPKSVPVRPLKYNDIMVAAKKNADPYSSATRPVSPTSTKSRTFSLARRMSIRT